MKKIFLLLIISPLVLAGCGTSLSKKDIKVTADYSNPSELPKMNLGTTSEKNRCAELYGEKAAANDFGGNWTKILGTQSDKLDYLVRSCSYSIVSVDSKKVLHQISTDVFEYDTAERANKEMGLLVGEWKKITEQVPGLGDKAYFYTLDSSKNEYLSVLTSKTTITIGKYSSLSRNGQIPEPVENPNAREEMKLIAKKILSNL